MYIDSNCSNLITCRFWDEVTYSWSTAGVTTSLSADNAVAYCDSLIYALMFKEKETNKMAIAWLIAYGATFALIEPFQVFVAAGMP